MTIVLPLTYLGNIQYFTKLCFCEECVIDVHEHFVKQSFRNRCHILSTGGATLLTVPTVKTPNDRKASVRDTRIDYSKRWQHRHWESIVSAYRNSPYFDFYEERFAPFYGRRYDFLFDLNRELTELVIGLLGGTAALNFSAGYISPSDDIADFRRSLSDKPRLYREDPAFNPLPYYQVFGQGRDFAENLSVIDLLFCEGPHALAHLERCMGKGGEP